MNAGGSILARIWRERLSEIRVVESADDLLSLFVIQCTVYFFIACSRRVLLLCILLVVLYCKYSRGFQAETGDWQSMLDTINLCR